MARLSGGFAGQLARQLAAPSGATGRWLGRAMDLANRSPTRQALDLLAPRPGERLLDAGCGTGAALAALHRRAACELAGVDGSEVMIGAARRRLGTAAPLHHARIEALPFADASFDGVLALNVLYFCDAESRMLASLRRVLRPGGRLVAYVTHRETMERWSFAHKGLHRLFDEAALTEALVLAGFARERICVHVRPVTRSVRGLFACAGC